MAQILYTLMIFFLFSAQWSWAQKADKGAVGSEFGIHMGPSLPDQIKGIQDILPTWGARAGINVGGSFLEIGGAHSRTNGVVYYNGHISSRADFNVVPDLTAFFYSVWMDIIIRIV